MINIDDEYVTASGRLVQFLNERNTKLIGVVINPTDYSDEEIVVWDERTGDSISHGTEYKLVNEVDRITDCIGIQL